MGGASASAIAYAYLRLRCLAWNPGKKEPSCFSATAQLATGSSIVISLFFWLCLLLCHSRKISCFSSTTRTDFLIVALLKTHLNLIRMCYFHIECLQKNTLETWLRRCINCTLLCFYSCVLLILRPPTLIFSHFRMIFPCYGLSYTLTLSRFYWIFVTGDQYIHRKTTRRRKCRQG